MAGAAIWNKSPRSVVVDQTMKKALIKRADTRLVACEAASSFCCDHLARVGQVGGGLTTLLMSFYLNSNHIYLVENLAFEQNIQANISSTLKLTII